MQGTALIIMHPAISHVNASLGIAESLRGAKYQVAYAGHFSIREMIDRNKYRFYELDSMPFGSGYERFYNSKENRTSYLDILLLKLSDKIYHDRKKDLNHLVSTLNPEAIFLDPFLSTDFVLLYEYAKKQQACIFILQTMFSTCKAKYYPPLSSKTTPKFNTYSYLSIETEWVLKYLKFKWWRTLQMVKYLGRDDYSNVKRKLKKHISSRKYKIENFIHLNYSFTNLPEVIIAPQELEFTNSKLREYHFYSGHQIDRSRVDRSVEKSFYETRCQLAQQKVNHGIKIIYLSFGTRYELHRTPILNFIECLLVIATTKRNYRIVITADEELQSQITNKPDNVFIYKRVDQISMLEISDLFISHGGLNSIKESIYCKVPLLIYPLETIGDQPGNAARVEFHKLGRTGDLEKINIKELIALIDSLIQDNVYKENIRKFNEHLKKYTSEYFIKYFIQAKTTYWSQDYDKTLSKL
ncbi:MAG: glycosyltransferase [Cyclobacteriaceae bacterium]